MFQPGSLKKIKLFVLLFLVGSATLAQNQQAIIDVKHYTFAIKLNDQNDEINGDAEVTLKFLKSARFFDLDLVNKNTTGKGMTVTAVTENGKTLNFKQDSSTVAIYSLGTALSSHSYHIRYSGIPADGLIISKNKYGHRTFFGDNWPNRAHNWLPCVDNPHDKATVEFIVTAPDHYQVVSNGLKIAEKALPGSMKVTHWKESVALPTKVMVIGVAEFAIDHTGDVNGIPVYTYVFPENQAEGFKNYAIAKEILPFYIDRVGPYSYEKLANVQSKTIFGGMENASAIFYFEESYRTKGIEELMAHEIAHQWFGDGASEKSFAHLWLSEGFATYMTDAYLEHKYGLDTLKKRLIADRKMVTRFEKKRLTPVVDTAVKINYMQLLNANSYQKGGWVLHMLRRKLGDAIFWKSISNYYAQYNGSNANTDDLRTVMEKTSGQDLKPFFKEWLLIAGHPDLAISWQYNAAGKEVAITIDQKQQNLYEFPLELRIDGQMHTIDIKNKTTLFKVKQAEVPKIVEADPNVNLLASFEIIAQ